MKPMHIAMALLSAAMFFVLAGVFMGVQLELDGTKLVVDSASDVRWQWVFIGTAVVFFFQLLRPAFQKGLKSVSGPKFILPAIDGSTVKQKLFLVALLVLAVAWPFMVSRGTVDIAGVRRFLRHRRLHLCAAQSLLRLGLLDLSADCRVNGSGGGLPARLSGAASAW